ncbi:unnamed protein product [Hermetia illucens]|uniref:Uncharacterized protein n=1 Tax=Hermetia illucens TaxID=343691 RepID=A0A7R8V5Q1_HERIL|nr:unnamed protein product [Hermetia illucens]
MDVISGHFLEALTFLRRILLLVVSVRRNYLWALIIKLNQASNVRFGGDKYGMISRFQFIILPIVELCKIQS